MSGISLRNALIEQFQDLLADPVVFPGTAYGIQVPAESIAMHGGGITADERSRYLNNYPAVLVAVLGTSGVDYIEAQDQGGVVSPRFIVNVAVIAQDVAGEGYDFHRSDVALAIAEKIANAVMFDRPDESSTDVTRFRMDNAWSPLSDSEGFGMWSLVWEQGAEIQPQDADDLPDFILCETTLSMGGDATPDVVGRATVNPDGVDTEAP